MRLSKMSKVLIIIFSVILVLSILLGCLTRISLGQSSLDQTQYATATLSQYTDYGAIYDADEIIDQLKDAPYKLVVKKISSENAHECLKSTVRVEQVVEGADVQVGDEIIVYEVNNFETYDIDTFDDLGEMLNETLHYINRNPTNTMNTADEYLVFLSELDLCESYKKYNALREFSPYMEMDLIPVFNLNKGLQTEYIPDDTALELTFADVEEYEFISFSQKSLDTLNAIKQAMLQAYITE